MYQILEGVSDSCSYVRAVNFRVENNIPVPTVVQFVPADPISSDPACDELEAGSSSFSDLTGLRRSKRRNLQPERFLGCDTASEIDIGNFRSRPYKIDHSQDDEMSLPLSRLFRVKARVSEVHSEDEKRVGSHKEGSSENLLVCKSNTKSMNAKSGVTKRKERQAQLASTSTSDKSEVLYLEYSHLHAKSTPIHAKKSSEISLQYYYNNKSRVRQKHTSDFEDRELGSTWEGKNLKKRTPKKKYHSSSFKNPTVERTYQRRTLSAGAYKEMINSFLKNMDCTSNHEQNITDQWKEYKPSGTEAAPAEEEEMSETEMLWKEMELALASNYLSDDDEVIAIYICIYL